MSNSNFLCSSFGTLPNRYFDGYCFIGSDFISGRAGLNAFEKSTSKIILPGEDGCYISVHKEAEQHVIGVDFNGYNKLFYYDQNNIWAVSNSPTVLSHHLKEKGIKLTANYPQLASWFVDGPFGDQLSSFNTFINEIYLLPSWCRIVIKNNNLLIKDANKRRILSYDEALKRYLEIWIGRIEGLLLRGDLFITADLTGGRDSRTVLGLIAHACNRLGMSFSSMPHLSFTSSTLSRLAKDLDVAKSISDVYGLNLNDKTAFKNSSYLDLESSYQRWKDLCLGVYGPIYFPSYAWPTHDINLPGNGSESYRSFYPLIEPEAFLGRKGKIIRSASLSNAWKDQTLSAIKTLERRADKPTHPLILHYREFRDRCHSGRVGQYITSCIPLGSSLLLDCFQSCEKNSLEGGQIIFDLMANLSKGLINLPYHPEKSSPTKEILGNLTPINLSTRPNPGNVFNGDNFVYVDNKKNSFAERLTLLRDDLNSNLHDIPDGFFSEEYINNAIRTIDDAILAGMFSHPRDGKAASLLLLASFVSKVAND